MKLPRILAACLLLLSSSVAAEGGWRDMQGNPVPETAASRSQDGFSAALVITADKDWQQKWDTPPENVPHFTSAHEVAAGGELHILAFLSNPRLDATGAADVACDFVVLRPDGSKSIDERDMPCFNARLATDPTHVYLTNASLKYVAEPADPRGTWTVHITVEDRVRGVSLPLSAQFVVR